MINTINGVVRNHRARLGCRVETFFKFVDNVKTKFYICRTHNQEVCRCGIEYGFHSQFYDLYKESDTLPLSDGEQILQEIGRETDTERAQGIKSSC